MFGFSRDEMRTLGGGTPEQRPQSLSTTAAGLVSPPVHPIESSASFPSELEGASHSAILEWQQAQEMAQQNAAASIHPTNAVPSPSPQSHIHADPTQAPIVYPEAGQAPSCSVSTASPSAPQYPLQSPPIPTQAQSQWLAQQPPPSATGNIQGPASVNGHGQGGMLQSPSPSQVSAQPAVHQPMNNGIQPYGQGLEPHHQTQSPPLLQSQHSGLTQPAGSPPPQQMQSTQQHTLQGPSTVHNTQSPQAGVVPSHTLASAQPVVQPASSGPSIQSPLSSSHSPPATTSPLVQGLQANGVSPQIPPQSHTVQASSPSYQYPPPNAPTAPSPLQVASPSQAPHPTLSPTPSMLSPHLPVNQHIVQQHGQLQALPTPAQGHYVMQHQAATQPPVHAATHPAPNPNKTKLKPSKKPSPNHRPSISSMSMASSVSSVSADASLSPQPISPPTYYQVVQQPQVQMQMQMQPMPQQPQQYISMSVGQPVTYPWKCSSCGVGLSPKNVYHECLICSSADIASKLCQTCYLHGANHNSLALGHDVTYYICNQDAVITNDSSIPMQKWTVKQNQFGRRWYQSCTQPVKTYIRPMTTAIPNHSGWIEAKTKQGNETKVFWVNVVTGETTWQRPPTGMPKGWREVRTPEGKPFYVHDALELATWVYPGHQPAQSGQAPQQAATKPVASVPAQLIAQAQASSPPTAKPSTSPPIIHAPQPLRNPVSGTITVQSPPPKVNLQGHVQVNLGGGVTQPVPQQQVVQQAVPQPQIQQLQPQPQPQPQSPLTVQVQVQQQPLTAEQLAEQKAAQKAAKKELKSAGKQLGIATAGGVMTAGLRMLGVPGPAASAMSNGVIKVGKAGVNVRRSSKPQVQQQSPSDQTARPVLQATYSSDGSDSGQVLLTPQSPPVGMVGMQQQMQGQYFVDAQGRPVQIVQQPAQVTNIQNIQQVQQMQQQQDGGPVDVNIGGLQIGDSSGIATAPGSGVVVDNSNTTFVANSSDAAVLNTYVAQDNAAVANSGVVNGAYVYQDNMVASPDSLYANPLDTTTSAGGVAIAPDTNMINGSYVAVDTASYVDVTTTTTTTTQQSEYLATDTSTGFAGTTTGPVPTDLGGYCGGVAAVEEQQTSVAVTSVETSYAYESMAQTGQENSLGLIDETAYEEVEVEDYGEF